MFGKDTVWSADMAKSPMGNLRKLRGRRKRPHPRYWPMPAFRISIIYSYLTSKSTNSIPTCFAEARAVFAEAILQEIAKKWHGGSSRKQIFRGRIRRSCGCVRGSCAEGFAEARPYVQQSKKEFLTPLICFPFRQKVVLMVGSASSQKSNPKYKLVILLQVVFILSFFLVSTTTFDQN